MKLRKLLLTTLVVVLISTNGYAYDATGIWNYTESNLQNYCDEPYILEQGEISILQEGSTFLIVSDAYSTQGTVSGSTYNFSEKWSDVYDFTLVSISSQSSITLTSLTAGSGPTNFTASWTDWGGGSCSGSFTTTVSRQAPVDPVYDATGRWGYDLSNIYYNCGAGPDATSGYFDVIQTGNKVTAVDNRGNEYKGFVNGTQYRLFRSYLDKGGRTTDRIFISLSSSTQGSGEAGFIWDDDSTECWGDWNISITFLPPDLCPNDPNKTEPGICGCGVADTDSDGDGTADCNDLCVNDPNKTEPGICGCGVADTDSDGDGIADCIDTDVDGDGLSNTEEVYCGSDPTDPNSKCVRLPFLMLLLD